MDFRKGSGEGVTQWELILSILSAAGCFCGIFFGLKNSRRDDARQLKDDALSLARIEGKLDSANRGIEDMRVEVRTHGNQIADLSTRVARCEESCKSAHHRIDTLEREE